MSQYKGAGVLLTYKGNALLGQRLGSSNVLHEVEYMGGKIEREDGNDPYQTAFAECVEELGHCLFSIDALKKRALAKRIQHPVSKKWFHLYAMELTKQEFKSVRYVCQKLHKWPNDEERCFWVTGREKMARKAFETLVTVRLVELQYLRYMFCRQAACSRTLNHAKKVCEQYLLNGTDVVTGETRQYALRAFNLIMLQ